MAIQAQTLNEFAIGVSVRGLPQLDELAKKIEKVGKSANSVNAAFGKVDSRSLKNNAQEAKTNYQPLLVLGKTR